jgi:benzoylformate decarboxylase
MATVRQASFEFLRRQRMTTVFGNPGSTELPMLADFPDDFTYVLGLQEAVVVGMADGFAQASGRATLVNLHTAPGVGNGMGAIFNAQANHTPLVITAGQQARNLVTMQANLTNRDAVRLPHPLVKWSYEPPRAEDVPHALARATHMAILPPRGPVFVSVPMDDWDQQADETAQQTITRAVQGRTVADPDAIRALARDLSQADNPVLVAGPDIDAAGAWNAAVALAERRRLPVWASPAPGGGRIGFPEDHRSFRGILPPAVGPLAETLRGHDLVLVVGASVFSYYPNIPGPLLSPGTRLVAVTSDPDEAARAPMGDAIVADVRLTLEALLEHLEEASDRDQLEPRPPAEPPEESEPMQAAAAVAALADVFPAEGIVVLEAPSATPAVRNRLRMSRPGSFFLGAGGGLGFGLAAALGVQLAQPQRPVVCVVGEGSAQYAIQAFWTAAAYDIPVTVLVLRNEEYSILKWFGTLENIEGAPGLDLPALDVAGVARAYGVPGERASHAEQLRDLLREAIAASEPRLVEARVAPGMALL